MEMSAITPGSTTVTGLGEVGAAVVGSVVIGAAVGGRLGATVAGDGVGAGLVGAAVGSVGTGGRDDSGATAGPVVPAVHPATTSAATVTNGFEHTRRTTADTSRTVPLGG
jgi:hypothetical protein